MGDIAADLQVIRKIAVARLPAPDDSQTDLNNYFKGIGNAAQDLQPLALLISTFSGKGGSSKSGG